MAQNRRIRFLAASLGNLAGAHGPLWPGYRPCRRAGGHPVWGVVWLADGRQDLRARPDLGGTRLHARAAYTNPALQEERLAKGVKLGLLTPTGKGEYHLTNAGHAAVHQLIDAAYVAMAQLKPLPESELRRLLDLLRRLVEASLAAPEPPGKWCLRIARHFDPAGRAGMTPQLDQYLSDLTAYRDDAHLATWNHSASPGRSGRL